MKILEIQKELDKLKPLRFSPKKDKPKSIKECVKRMINGEATYMNSDTSPQCQTNRYRGIADMYRLSKHYFPTTQLHTILDYLSNKKTNFCTTTNQNVYSCKFTNYHRVNKSPQVRIGGSRGRAVQVEK